MLIYIQNAIKIELHVLKCVFQFSYSYYTCTYIVYIPKYSSVIIMYIDCILCMGETMQQVVLFYNYYCVHITDQ